MERADPPSEQIKLVVNDKRVTAVVEPRKKLSDFLKLDRGIRSVRMGCEQGVCGACMVRLDGELVKSCLLYATHADGAEVETIENLADDDELHPVQQAFHQSHGLQCGYCTSGFVLSTVQLLEHNPDPDREDVEEALAGNICRCTGYQKIHDAVKHAASKLEIE